MNLQQCIEKVEQAAEQRRADAGERYRQLITDTCDDVAVSPEVAAEILHDAGKSPEQLQKDCQLMAQRRSWAATLATRDDVEKKLELANAEVSKITAERDAAMRKFNERINAAALKRAEGTDAMTAVSTAESQLNLTAWPHILAAEKQVYDELSVIGEQRQLTEIELSRKRNELQKFISLRDNENTFKRHVSKEQREHYRGTVKGLEQHIREVEAQLAEGQRVADEMLAEIAELGRQKLVP